MKLKLLLCCSLMISAVCFAAPDEEEEDDETTEIVSDPLLAMGRAPGAVAKKISDKGVATVGVVGGDPYAMAKQNLQPEVSVGDPYAKNVVKVDIPTGDPYVSIGASVSPPISVKNVKKITKKPKAEKKPSAVVGAEKKKVAKMPSVPLPQSGPVSKDLLVSNGPFAGEEQAVVREIDREVRSQEEQLKLVAAQNLITVQQEISQQATQLREEADAAAKALKATTEGRVQELLANAAERIGDLNQEISEKALELKQEAAKKALIALDEIETRAAEKRLNQRKRVLAKTFGLPEVDAEFETTLEKKKEKKVAVSIKPKKVAKKVVATGPATPDAKVSSAPADATTVSTALRVPAEWKNDLSRRFYQDMATMKEIIVEAESPSEAQDFLKKFEEQNKWFDLTLRSTRAVTDEQYKQLIEKQSQMSRLMQAQRVADDYLQKFTKNMIMEPLQLKKIRLNVLYELNAKTQQRASHLDRSIRESALPENEVKSLVKRTLSEISQQFREIAAQFPDVEIEGISRKPQLSLAAVPLATQQLEEELNKTKELAAATQQELATAKQELAGVQDTAAQAQAALDQERNDKDLLAKEAASVKTTALQILDKQAKNNLDTELALTGVQQDSAALKGELVLAGTKNMKLQQQRKQLVGSVEEARKETMQANLLRGEDKDRNQKTIQVMQSQAKNKLRAVTESGARRELSLMADLRQAHEKIGVLSAKQTKLVQDLEQQYKKTAALKNSLKVAQEAAGKAESLAALANRSLVEKDKIVKWQVSLRKQAQERAKLTEKLAQQTIDSINGFLQTERKGTVNQNKKLATNPAMPDDQEDFLSPYTKQLAQDRDMLEGLKRETRKVVEHSANLSESLSDDFVRMQEQIESELRLAQQETQQELAIAQDRLKKMRTGEATMPGVKQLAGKQSLKQMPGTVFRGPVGVMA